MSNATKTFVSLLLAALLWGVETWLLIDAAGYTFTPQVAVIPTATAALAFLPLVLKDASQGLRAAILIACVFLAGYIFSGVLERTGGQLDTKIASAQAQSEGRKLLEAELSRERARLKDAEDNMKNESRRGGCGPTCKTWSSAIIGIQARIDRLVSEMGAKQAPMVADPVSQRFADMTGGAVSVETIRNWRPAFQPLGFLIAIWSLFGFGFRDGETVSTVSEAGNSPETEVGGGGKALRVVPAEDHEVAALRRALSGGRKLTNDELAKLMRTTKGEASKRVEKAVALGIVSKVRTGRHVAISMHAH